jgi:DNA-3-methyladenine glycosylase II
VDTVAYEAELERATAALAAVDPALGAVIASIGPCRLAPAWERSPFESLVRAVAYQQLHGRAAAAILGRFTALFPAFPTPEQVLALDEASFRAVGFSGAKAVAIADIAAKAAAGIVPTRAEAEALSDEELIHRLVSIRGVGQWTVEMLLIFTLGRLDVFPVDDFGVRTGMQRVYELAPPLRKRELVAQAERWRPYRSVASWYFWRVADIRTPS